MALAALTIVLITVTPIIFILTAPVVLRVNTDQSDYSVHMGSLCSVCAVPSMNNPGFRLRIGFWKKTWNLAQRRLKLDMSVRNMLRSKRVPKKYRSRGFMKRILRVIRTFNVNTCDVELDTDDFVLNAQLFPLFQFCNNRWGNWHVNFEGDCALRLEVQGRMIRVLYAWLFKK